MTDQPSTVLAASEHVVEDILRVSDLDFQRHMGNTAFTQVFANARFAFLSDCVRPTVGFDVILALVKLEVEFTGQVHYPATIRTRTRIEKIGRTSMTLLQTMSVGEKDVASSRSVFVLTDRDSGRSMAWPDEVRALLDSAPVDSAAPTPVAVPS
ncbi:thioesterase family protein [Rhodococcus sp. HM1]|uniref:acyl-CoA thioesterase n=1 Tax=unclassified Rhodococcus (in: high G+C Gram-positive bacteria) TaxID=192944 RepID=UPI0018CE1197|nr:MULTISPECIES: thioesterase family protein [unclassified Rhodococcus (in: high G+C Gram-positive bacteria)]MBH0122199.1 thioesterase family protein [Rhodococcus sp. CX]MCK8669947.1 thioesterase family protein [Rhodococcus sp. HM1]